MISRLLIANRGEIAVRVARGAREMGITPLGIYSDADAQAYHLRFMDDARCVGGAAATESYLNVDNIIAAARDLRADAVHPGYGFLSERAAFARAVVAAGMTFVGPSADAMAAMGSKIDAKQRVRTFDVPTVPGYDGDDQSVATLRDRAAQIGFPLLIKASAGGGGRGMRIVEKLEEFDDALDAAKREARAAFGDDTVLLERYLRDPRHIEFQVLADSHGTTLHIGERECSIQRRHQKIVEEAPSVALSPELRATMGAAAVRAAQSVGYVNAGTCEFMLDGDGAFYFLEMNTRLQVEHPVTEMVYGLDLVQWQLRIANGERLTFSQDDVRPHGWSIETRIYAEDPANHMLPSTGTISRWTAPDGPGVRLDEGVGAGSEVSVYYDPMLAKLVVFGSNRQHAVRRLRNALDDFVIDGVRSNLPLLRWIARDEWFACGKTTTSFLAARLDESIFAPREVDGDALLVAAAGAAWNEMLPWRLGGIGAPFAIRADDTTYRMHVTRRGDELQVEGAVAATARVRARDGAMTIDTGGRTISGSFSAHGDRIDVDYDNRVRQFTLGAAPSAQATGAGSAAAANDGRLTAPMPGKIVKIAVAVGDDVQPHAPLIVLEAMKMEHRIDAPNHATVAAILVREGEIVAGGAPLVELRAAHSES